MKKISTLIISKKDTIMVVASIVAFACIVVLTVTYMAAHPSVLK